MNKLNQLSAVQAARFIARREITAEALARACLERIGEREPQVQAWVHCDPEHALRQARALDAGPVRGLLHGLPVGVKDIFDTWDMPTEYGSPIYKAHRPAWDAAAVALTRAAGGVILGKTVTTEFAAFTPRQTRNPHNTEHTPGGSSSGSAAAVADCQVPLAFGSQTAGSVIRPASFCGVVGYKPTYNTIPRAGVKALADTLDTIGVLARTVPDAALFTAALTSRKELLIEGDLDSPPRVGICRTHEWPSAQPEMVQALEWARERLAAAGAAVGEVILPEAFSGLLAAQHAVIDYEDSRSLYFEFTHFPELVSEPLREKHIAPGIAMDAARYVAALALARDCRAALPQAFGDWDVLLAPAAPGEAPRGLESTGDPVMNRVWTLLHAPCITVPAGKGPHGLPLGLQAVGRIGDDARTLIVAHWIHQRLAPG